MLTAGWFWLTIAIGVFWALGAYNRLVRLQSQVQQSFDALELRLLCDLAGRLPRADLGLTLGQGFGFTGYGPFSFLLLTCANAYEALQCGLRYQQLTFLFSPLSFVPGERESALCLTPL